MYMITLVAKYIAIQDKSLVRLSIKDLYHDITRSPLSQVPSKPTDI